MIIMTPEEFTEDLTNDLIRKWGTIKNNRLKYILKCINNQIFLWLSLNK